MGQIKITQVKSLIAEPVKHRKVIRGLGLGRIGNEKTHKDNNCIRGMVNKVRHLLKYELID